MTDHLSTSNSSRRAIAILAGGASRRMGSDKAELVLGTRTFLARTVAAARAANLDVFVVGRASHSDAGRVDRWIADESPGAGPMAALASALRAACRDLLVVACDMPLVEAAALAWLTQATSASSADAVVVVSGKRIQPLFGHYSMTCLPVIDALREKGEQSMRALIEAVRCERIVAPGWVGNQLVNINTQAELDALRAGPRSRLA